MDTTRNDAALPPERTAVLVVGSGPCGLMLCNELGRRGIATTLIDERAGGAALPQANATQARTMEHFRRLGFADEIRGLGLPIDFPTDIAYFTRFAGHELARFSLPSARAAKQLVHTTAGSWSAAELPHRVSQKFVEGVLRRHAAAHRSIALHPGWRLVRFDDRGSHVEARIERVADGRAHTIRSEWLFGADGARSTVRQGLGIRYGGETGVTRHFMGGRMLAVHLRAPAFYDAVPHPPAWMNGIFNAERRAFMAAIDGRGEFAFHTQLRADEREDAVTDADALALFQNTVGLALPAELLGRAAWTAGHSLVADRFGAGRVLIGGDAVHLFTPTGGLGYNTAVEDAVNVAWKLAAVVRGHAPPGLLATYEAERRPLALRNTAYARGFADSLGCHEPVPEIEDASAAGVAARAAAGAYLEAHGRAEFNIPGVTFGGRYDASPIIVGDGSVAPPDRPNVYEPTASPGGRPPHAWLSDGVSLYDTFHAEWTLLALDASAAEVASFRAAAASIGIDLGVVTPPDSARLVPLYEAPLTLIRPDQIVAWRGTLGAAAARLREPAPGGLASSGSTAVQRAGTVADPALAILSRATGRPHR
ncbi:MAG: FAD-dependent oxidoreductase [Caldimonas sp.]